MYSAIKCLVFTFLDFFLKPEYFKILKIENFNNSYKHPYNLISNEKLYLGTDVQKELLSTSITTSEKEEFQNNCLRFYIELIDQIMKRFDFKNKMVEKLDLLNPKNILENKVLSFLELFELYPNLINTNDVQKGDMEFREIRNLDFKNMFDEDFSNINVIVFGSKYYQKKNVMAH